LLCQKWSSIFGVVVHFPVNNFFHPKIAHSTNSTHIFFCVVSKKKFIKMQIFNKKFRLWEISKFTWNSPSPCESFKYIFYEVVKLNYFCFSKSWAAKLGRNKYSFKNEFLGKKNFLTKNGFFVQKWILRSKMNFSNKHIHSKMIFFGQ